MENLDAIRKIDELGRIILPKEFMKDMSWNIRDSLLMTYNIQSGIATLKLHEKAPEPRCVFCEANESKVKINDVDVCVGCLEKIKKL